MARIPDLLRSRVGRMVAFFGLYISQGLPQGYTGTAVVLLFKRMGMTGAAIGSFGAFLTLPWAWKWVMGPLVDNLHLRRFGRRKQWILCSQVGMLVTMVVAMCCFPRQSMMESETLAWGGLRLFTLILLVNNMFAATQDVAIDALACDTLQDHERGLANGLMFAGCTVGTALGGSCVLYLKDWVGFTGASTLVPVLLCGILALVWLMIFERSAIASDSGVPLESPSLHRAMREIGSYFTVVLRTFLRTRRGFLGMVLAILPFGGMALSLTVSTVLTPTLGMTDNEIANLGLACSLVFTVFCMAGGYLSDRFGRRLTLTVFSLLTLIPTVWMGWRLKAEGWDFPLPAGPDGTWPRHEGLILAWWIAGLVYSVFSGLMYGIRTAFYMDIVEPRIAATQFTACMALLNLSTSLCYWWEGQATTEVAKGGWGLTYYQIFLIDALVGGVFVFLIPFARPRVEEKQSSRGHGALEEESQPEAR